jgi:hypothetical protein
MPFLLIPRRGEFLCIQLCIDRKSSWQNGGRPIEEVEHRCVAPVFGSAQWLGWGRTGREKEDVDVVCVHMGVECLTENISPYDVLYDVSVLPNLVKCWMCGVVRYTGGSSTIKPGTYLIGIVRSVSLPVGCNMLCKRQHWLIA